MIFLKNNFFNENLELKDFSKLTFNSTFKKFEKFLIDDAFLNFDKRLISTITTHNIEENTFFSGALRKELVSKYNKQMIENVFTFYEPLKNQSRLDDIFEENIEITTKQLSEIKDKYFDDSIEKIDFSDYSIIQVSSFNEQLVFFIKKILQNWLIKQNKELNEKKIFFPGKENENIHMHMIQDVFINEGLKKTFSINYKIQTENYKINTEIIKKINYNDLSILDFFNLNENYKKIKEKNHKNNKHELNFYFGNIYFLLNTKQNYILNDFKELLLSIGINSFKIDELPDIEDKENYITMSILQLFKLNLGYKND